MPEHAIKPLNISTFKVKAVQQPLQFWGKALFFKALKIMLLFQCFEPDLPQMCQFMGRGQRLCGRGAVRLLPKHIEGNGHRVTQIKALKAARHGQMQTGLRVLEFCIVQATCLVTKHERKFLPLCADNAFDDLGNV